jgi:hypothetical protein
VDVNREVIGLDQVPLLEDIGSISKNAPKVITAKKPRQIVLAGFTLIPQIDPEFTKLIL